MTRPWQRQGPGVLTPHGERGRRAQGPLRVGGVAGVVAGILDGDGGDLQTPGLQQHEPRDPHGAAGQCAVSCRVAENTGVSGPRHLEEGSAQSPSQGNGPGRGRNAKRGRHAQTGRRRGPQRRSAQAWTQDTSVPASGASARQARAGGRDRGLRGRLRVCVTPALGAFLCKLGLRSPSGDTHVSRTGPRPVLRLCPPGPARCGRGARVTHASVALSRERGKDPVWTAHPGGTPEGAPVQAGAGRFRAPRRPRVPAGAGRWAPPGKPAVRPSLLGKETQRAKRLPRVPWGGGRRRSGEGGRPLRWRRGCDS